MTICLCGLTLSLLSAMASDLGTTADFTARGHREMNPLARPFVEGRGARGEVVLGALSAGAYLALDAGRGPRVPRPLALAVQGVALVVHATLAVRNVRTGYARETPPIMFPVLVLTW